MLSLDRKIASICILSVFLTLLGCKAQYHIERAEKHREKALNKGAVFSNDTTYIYGDTIVTTYWKDSIRVVEKIVTNEVFVEGEVRYITKKDKRIARRKERKADKYRFKLAKQEIKKEAKIGKKRSWWFIWYALGIVTMLLLKFVWNKYLKYFFNRI